MKMEEFLEAAEPEPNEPEESVELDVQKAVVESLAADKAEQDEKIGRLQSEVNSLKSAISDLKDKLTIAQQALEQVGETLARNTELPLSNQVSLLDRNPEVDDRFEGETRDQILEVLKDARETAEREGWLRRAQILESVLLANEPTGNLLKKRAELEKIFADNNNILSGEVINRLDKMNITYKIGDNYLLAKEIIKRAY